MSEVELIEEFNPVDLTKYLPEWIPATDNVDTLPASSTLLYKFFEAYKTPLTELEISTNVAKKGILNDEALGTPRLAWYCDVQLNDIDYTLEIKTSSDSGYTTIRRSISPYDFLTAVDPVFIVTESKLPLFRNLHYKSCTLSSTSLMFTLPEVPLEDERLKIYTSEKSIFIVAGSSNYTQPSGIIYLPTSGTASGLYPSQTRKVELEAEECIYLDHIKKFTPIEFDLWNYVDEHGLLVGITRLHDESNTDLVERIKSAYILPPSDERINCLYSIARDVGLNEYKEWDGITTLVLETSGSIDNITVPGLDKYIFMEYEEPITSDNKTFYTKYTDYLDGYILYLNGYLIQNTNTRYPTISGNSLTFSAEIKEKVGLRYRVQTYSVTTTGTSTLIVPTQNSPAGSYVVLYTKQLSATVPTETTLSEDMAEQVRGVTQIVVGNTTWSRNAKWFTDNELTPELSNRNLEFD